MVALRSSARNVASIRPAVLAIVVPLLALATAACDKVPLTAPTGSTITLFSSTNYVPVNGTAQITATVIESAGTAVQNGTEVTFTTSLGTINPPSAQTKNGQVTVTFTAGAQSGTARVTALSGAASGSGSTGGNGGTTAGTGGATIEITIGGAGASRIVVNASPATVPSSGGTVEITATVFDASGNRLPGVPVTFSTSAGTLSQATVVTSGDGEARTRLTTDRNTTVTVSAGAATAVTLNIEANAAPTVTITPPTTVTVGQPATFTITTGPAGRVFRDLTIDFGDGERVSLGAPPAGTIPVSHVYRAAGTYTVRATATDINAEQSTFTTIITVVATVPPNLTLDFSDNPVAVNAPVTISVSTGGLIGGGPANILRYEYNFGDGTTAILNSNQTTHVYRSPGTYTVTVTAVTVEGLRIVAQGQLVVES